MKKRHQLSNNEVSLLVKRLLRNDLLQQANVVFLESEQVDLCTSAVSKAKNTGTILLERFRLSNGRTLTNSVRNFRFQFSDFLAISGNFCSSLFSRKIRIWSENKKQHVIEILP